MVLKDWFGDRKMNLMDHSQASSSLPYSILFSVMIRSGTSSLRMVLQSAVSQLSVIKRQSKSYCRMKLWISSQCFTADLVLIRAHEVFLSWG